MRWHRYAAPSIFIGRLLITMRRLLLLLCVVMASSQLVSCAVNPATGGANVVLATSSALDDIGLEMYEQLRQQGAFYDDPEVQAYVSRIGQSLVAVSDMPDATFTFTVIDNPAINAYATPGGYVYVNRGLLAYLDTEDELAGVLAHEIGHVTARHSARQKTARTTSKVLSVTTLILTGSGSLAGAADTYGAQLISGYGREMELEADSLGARYMHKAGYNTDALLEVIGVLKDQERYQRSKAGQAGESIGSYHGLYSTHPKNDKRLQQVIRTASQLDEPEKPLVPRKPIRHFLNGLVFGDSIQSKREDNRFYHNKLGFTFMQPEGWMVNTSAENITATDPSGAMSLTIALSRIPAEQTPEPWLKSRAIGTLTDPKTLEQAGLSGYSAIATANGIHKRLAVIHFNGLAYQFEGAGSDFSSSDAIIMPIIESFRPIHPTEKQVGQGRRIEFIQVPRGASIASLAAESQLPDIEDQLRLINGLYPDREPKVGDWIKIIR
jgi:predicted Zn-dependent protease